MRVWIMRDDGAVLGTADLGEVSEGSRFCVVAGPPVVPDPVKLVAESQRSLHLCREALRLVGEQVKSCGKCRAAVEAAHGKLV